MDNSWADGGCALVGVRRETHESAGGDGLGPRERSAAASALGQKFEARPSGQLAALLAFPVDGGSGTGLRERCFAMVDKIASVPLSKVGSRVVGLLSDADLLFI